MLRRAMVLSAVLGLAACDAVTTATSCEATCAGCCSGEECITPQGEARCGRRGAVCVACGPGQSCSAGECVASMSSDSGADADAGMRDDAGTAEDGGAGEDAGSTADAGTGDDAGITTDAGAADDAGITADAGAFGDAGSAVDAGSANDAGPRLDAGTTQDAGGGSDGGSAWDGGVPQWVLDVGIRADQLGVLVNDADAVSMAVAAKYVIARGIPAKNVVTLHFTGGSPVMTNAVFDPLKATADAVALDAGLEAWVITWTSPYRVSCMSITTAFAAGFDAGFCSTQGSPCGASAFLQTYDDEGSPTRSAHRPHESFGVRPTMMLASGPDAGTALALIDRGLAADDTFPTGDGYFFRTTDSARSVRWSSFLYSTMPQWADGGVRFFYSDATAGGASSLVDGGSVLFYFQSLASVPNLATNTYLPGAIADHLTSYGGQVPTSGQMSILRWIEAGATGSYGTVVEPCNYTQKFPDTSVVSSHYYRGEPLVEAYWKSVAMPGEGLFIGEPLARPWGSSQSTYDGTSHTLTLTTTMMRPGLLYAIDSSFTPSGPWTRVQSNVSVLKLQRNVVTVPNATAAYYRLVRQ